MSSTPRTNVRTAAEKAVSTEEQEQVNIDLFVPEATRENYLQIVRDGAAAAGVTEQEALDQLAEHFANEHEKDQTAGWDHLAAWALQSDPTPSAAASKLAEIKARVTESARRDPQQALIGDQTVVDLGVQAVLAREEEAARSLAEGGAQLNPGPITGPDNTPPAEPVGESAGPTAEPVSTES